MGRVIKGLRYRKYSGALKCLAHESLRPVKYAGCRAPFDKYFLAPPKSQAGGVNCRSYQRRMDWDRSLTRSRIEIRYLAIFPR